MKDIGKVDYYRCKNCGFVLSKTHHELSLPEWEKLNIDFHHKSEQAMNNLFSGEFPPIPPQATLTGMRQPDYHEQAAMFNFLFRNEMIDPTSMLDYGGGYGTLTKIMQKYYGLRLSVYDPYVHNENNSVAYISLDSQKKFKVVFNSALLEHIRYRQDLDNINFLVDTDGCLIFHTIVCERIPKDPNWFYLGAPVHCAFHSNKSMKLLMEQWGYVASIYSPVNKCWILFKDNHRQILEKVKIINNELQQNYFYFKNGFVDYWKGF
jgi:hypothetical protein